MEGVVKQRFPLLERLRIQRVDGDSCIEPLLPVLDTFLAVMDAPPDYPICFVLPRCGDVGRVATVLFALHRFVAKQVEHTKSYAESNFKKGDLVCVHPGRHVYRFGGVHEEFPYLVWFETVDSNGRWAVPAASVVPRLEKTIHTKPIGRLNSKILVPQLPPVDALLGTVTWGNQRLFGNEVALVDAVGDFSRFLESVRLQLDLPIDRMPSLKSLLPFGELSQPTSSRPQWVKKWDDRIAIGDPLVAVTHLAELCASYSIDAPTRSRVVVVNGLSRFRQLQSFDDIMKTQHLILFAGSSEKDMIRALGARGCRFWHITADDLRVGAHAASAIPSGSMTKVVRWARNHERLTIETEPCRSEALERAHAGLEQTHRSIAASDGDQLTRMLSRAWQILGTARSMVRALTHQEQERHRARVEALRIEVRRNINWLTPEASEAQRAVVEGLDLAFGPSSKLGEGKQAALLRLVNNPLGGACRCAIVGWNEEQANEIRQWVRDLGYSGTSVYSARGVPDDCDVDHLICVAWFGAARMEDIASSLVAPRLTIIAYPFEERWVSQLRGRVRQRVAVPEISASAKRSFLGEACTGTDCEPESSLNAAPSSTSGGEVSIWDLENRLRTRRKGTDPLSTESSDSVPARYVSFIGDAYAFLTETHRLVDVTSLLSDVRGQNRRLPEHIIAELAPSASVVFPESGDREFIQEKADQLLGRRANDLRKLAHLWKDALWASGITVPQFSTLAKELGRPRHIVTIRNWFADTSQIGPGLGNDDLRADVELIAMATGFEPLEKNLSDVLDAIKELRSAHLSAGMRVRDALIRRLPEAIEKVEENGTRVDLGELGAAWIVQVESISPTTESRAQGEVNRLLWEHPQINLDDLL